MRKWIARIILVILLAAFFIFLFFNGELLNFVILIGILVGAFGSAVLVYFLIKWALDIK